MMKKLTALLTALFLLLSATALADEVIHIGIIQFAEHGSLDNCRIGFIEGLAEEGFVEGENVVFDIQNAQADTAISAQIADVMAGKYDMICAIATPAAMAAFNAAEDAGIPVIYTAVSDPVSAMLAGADGKNPGNITGTSDALPVEAQLKLIRALMPNATKIGILHTTSETNSDATLALYKELAPNYGFEIIDKGISTGADLPMALDALLPQVDCTTNLTDNTVVSYLAVNYRAERLGLGILLALGGQSDRGGEIGFGSGDYLLAVGAVDPNGRNALIAEDEVEILTLDHCV